MLSDHLLWHIMKSAFSRDKSLTKVLPKFFCSYPCIYLVNFIKPYVILTKICHGKMKFSILLECITMEPSCNWHYLKKLCMKKQGVSRFGVVITLLVQVTELVQIPETIKQRYVLKMSLNNLCWGLQELNYIFNSKSQLYFLFTMFIIHNALKTFGTESTKKNSGKR